LKSFSQARAQADVSITSLTLSEVKTKTIVPNTSATNVNDPAKKAVLMANDLKCIITVHNENDDDAYETKLVVVLPVEVSVSNLPANATVYTASPNSTFVGYVMVNLGHMYVGQNITIEFNLRNRNTEIRWVHMHSVRVRIRIPQTIIKKPSFKAMKRNLLFLVFMSAISRCAFAQPGYSADVSVASIAFTEIKIKQQPKLQSSTLAGAQPTTELIPLNI
jgi:hypothetical protein